MISDGISKGKNKSQKVVCNFDCNFVLTEEGKEVVFGRFICCTNIFQEEFKYIEKNWTIHSALLSYNYYFIQISMIAVVHVLSGMKSQRVIVFRLFSHEDLYFLSYLCLSEAMTPAYSSKDNNQ